MYYSSIGILALLILLIINFDVFNKNSHSEQTDSHIAYRHFLISVVTFYIADILWGLFYSKKMTTLGFIDTEIFFTSMATAVYFWTRFVIRYINKKNLFFSCLKYAGYAFMIGEIFVLILNCFVPFIFHFEKDGTYVTGRARYITIYIQILLYLATSAYMLVITLKSQGEIKHRYHTICLFGFAMMVFTILQALFPLMPFYSIGYMIGTCLIHTFVLENEKEFRRHELERLLQIEELQEIELGTARFMAYTDPLTGVKNKNAYLEDIQSIERRIADKTLEELGVAVFDLNGLKTINDTLGHEEGDKLIKAATKIICQTFKHSPIYRIGGDEFAALIYGEDYENREKLINSFNAEIDENQKNGKVVIACGFSRYIANVDTDYIMIFERADKKMYERKRSLKS